MLSSWNKDSIIIIIIIMYKMNTSRTLYYIQMRKIYI